MTPKSATRLTLRELESLEAASAAAEALPLAVGGTLAPPPRVPAPLRVLQGDERPLPAPKRGHHALHRRLLGCADLAGAALAMLVVFTVGHGEAGLLTFAVLPLVVLLFKVAGLYDREQMRVVHSTLDEVPLLTQLSGLYALSLTILAPVLVHEALAPVEILALWGISLFATTGGRMAARWGATHAAPIARCLVVGDPAQADRIREKLASSRARASVVAALPLAGGQLNGLGAAEMRRLVIELRIDRIIIAPVTTDANGVAELVRIAKASGVHVSVLPRLLEVVGSAVEFENLDGMTMLGLRPFGLSRSSRLLKRTFDVAAASVGLIAVAPILAAVAFAVRLDSRGPVFFRQVRVGRDGRRFRIFKFRSMVVGADVQKDRLRELNEVGDGMFKISADPRVTRVGDFLRRTSLDELPQLFNVLLGDMSLVGPRPLVVDEDARVMGLDRSRLHLTPGMTGPWQVLGARVPMQEMVGIDYLYVAGWSLWLDVKLLLRTARHVFRRGNV
jgi:exopolysaccharide biosynthesis polyprenyl glycosylphosphotransferase